MTLRLHYAVRSDVGHVRPGNEDSAYAGAQLLAVADGMGGHAAGEVASAAAIASLAPLDARTDNPAGPDGDADGTTDGASLVQALRAAVVAANDQLRDMVGHNRALDGMGTTVTALLTADDRLALAHVGDSRAYLLRHGVLTQVTRDHTLVQALLDEGRITPEQADTHPQRALITRALDGRRSIEPDVGLVEAGPGDRFLLCTDGLSGVVSDATIADALALPDPQEAVDRLVALALKGGGPDNVTVVVADVVEEDDGGPAGPGRERRPGTALVAGAAAESAAVPGAAAVAGDAALREAEPSPAEKAGRLSGRLSRLPVRVRSVGAAGAGTEADERPAPDRARRRRRLVVPAAVTALVVAAVLGGYAYVRAQYYVGVSRQRVALFQGVQGSLAGVRLSSVRERYMPVGDLSDFERRRVTEGIPADDLGDARRIISGLATRGSTVTAPAGASSPPSGGPSGGPSSHPPTTAAPTSAPAARGTPVPARRPGAPGPPSAPGGGVTPADLPGPGAVVPAALNRSEPLRVARPTSAAMTRSATLPPRPTRPTAR